MQCKVKVIRISGSWNSFCHVFRILAPMQISKFVKTTTVLSLQLLRPHPHYDAASSGEYVPNPPIDGHVSVTNYSDLILFPTTSSYSSSPSLLLLLLLVLTKSFCDAFFYVLFVPQCTSVII